MPPAEEAPEPGTEGAEEGAPEPNQERPGSSPVIPNPAPPPRLPEPPPVLPGEAPVVTGVIAPGAESSTDSSSTDNSTNNQDPASNDEPDDTGFRFGSYGRVVVASDLEGGTGSNADITSRNPRIDEGTYVELELARRDRPFDLRLDIVATLAFAGPLFHFDGDFEERFAIRNLYAEVGDLLTPDLNVWVGSRMVRGNDIYLLDFWPLDNLNLVGAGVRYAYQDLFELGVHGGLSRPNDPFQQQTVSTIAPSGFTPAEFDLLDRPRLVIAGKGVGYLPGLPFGAKLVLYGEGHSLPSGVRQTESGIEEALPSEDGFVLGAQLGLWSERWMSANLSFRYARGLGVFDPLSVPYVEGAPRSTRGASELRVGFSGHLDQGPLGVLVGAYYRRFSDGDDARFGGGELAEGAIAVRPQLWLGNIIGIALEGSYQRLETNRLDDSSGQMNGGSVTKLGVIPFISPNGRGSYTRPHLRIMYVATMRDEGARALYPARDPRSAASVEHFLGVGAEWWFDSTSYQ
ncbi:MAG: carbohydrate porin [Myxococcota bacterium]